MAFLAPYLLMALVALPVLWWLLRVTPPQPRRVQIPTFFLIRDIKADIKSAARTPWWLLLIRMACCACFIIGFASPVLHLDDTLPGRGGEVLVVVDNGWASAAGWDKRSEKIKEYLQKIDRSSRNVVFLPTAPDRAGSFARTGSLTPVAGESFLENMSPHPWFVDYARVLPVAKEILGRHKISHTVFFSDGLEYGDTGDFLRALQESGGGLTVVSGDAVNKPFILRNTEQKAGALSFTLEGLTPAASAGSLTLSALSSGGGVIDTRRVDIAAGEREAKFQWDIPSAIAGNVAQVSLRAPQMASAVFLTDSRWRQRPAGIAVSPAQKNDESFLNEVYYLRRALEAGSAPEMDTVENLMTRKLAVIVWPDSAVLTPVERVSLLEWVENGGYLIRFAGPNLAASTDDPLLPVRLRHGQRALQGAMTWEQPLKLGAIGVDSPLSGIAIPEDVTVVRQVLADPSPDVFEKTWLQLEDGTPLITGGAVGKGGIALVHTTAGPEWSNFCYSGLYVEVLRRVISLSSGISDFKAKTVLPPLQLLDGFGHLASDVSGAIAGSVDGNKDFSASPQTPPGIYGGVENFRVFNLGDSLPSMRPLSSVPSGASRVGYELSGESSLKDIFIAAALVLLLLDTVVTLALRGVLSFNLRGAASAAVVLLFLSPALSFAQEVSPADMVSEIYFGYVETGEQGTDSVSYNGLSGLKEVVSARTNIKVRGVRGVNLDVDDLYYYPFLYWPMSDSQQAISMTAVRNVQNYLAHGGMILFDTRDRQFAPADGTESGQATPGTLRLRKITQDIRIAELMPVEAGHIMTKSFYLLDAFPGLYAGGRLWVEKEPNPNHDALTSVVIGGNDWAAAWSIDAGDRARFIVTPGGETQREMAYRFGVNLVMAALAGNYKADQVHVPYILERLKR